jgi:hypothetical protein
VKGKTVGDVIAITEKLSKVADNKEQYQRIMSKLTKKMLKGKPINLEFKGSIKDMVKSPKPISEFASEEQEVRLTAYNEKLRANRTNWKEVD